MDNPEWSSHSRNKTLPLKSVSQVRSANKIKISMKGLPRDFFNHEQHQHFLRPLRMKTEPNQPDLAETSYFQQPLSPRQGREYKSEQRRRTPTEPAKMGEQDRGRKGGRRMESVMECTFFKSVALDSKTEPVRDEPSPSVRAVRKEKERGKSRGGKYDLDNLSQEDISSIFRARQRMNLSRLRPGLYRGLPMIRLCKPKAR